MCTQRDCADHLVAEFNGEIQSEHFGDKPTCSMENVTPRFAPETVTETAELDTMTEESERKKRLAELEVTHFHSCVSDDKQQDSHTAALNTQEMIERMRSLGLLRPGESTLCELMEGCTSQCRCATALFFLSALAMQFTLLISGMISAAGHGKGECNSPGGVDKSHVRKHMEPTARPETEDASGGNRVQAHRVVDGQIQSFADLVVGILSNPARQSGVQSRAKTSRMS